MAQCVKEEMEKNALLNNKLEKILKTNSQLSITSQKYSQLSIEYNQLKCDNNKYIEKLSYCESHHIDERDFQFISNEYDHNSHFI